MLGVTALYLPDVFRALPIISAVLLSAVAACRLLVGVVAVLSFVWPRAIPAYRCEATLGRHVAKPVAVATLQGACGVSEFVNSYAEAQDCCYFCREFALLRHIQLEHVERALAPVVHLDDCNDGYVLVFQAVDYSSGVGPGGYVFDDEFLRSVCAVSCKEVLMAAFLNDLQCLVVVRDRGERVCGSARSVPRGELNPWSFEVVIQDMVRSRCIVYDSNWSGTEGLLLCVIAGLFTYLLSYLL